MGLIEGWKISAASLNSQLPSMSSLIQRQVSHLINLAYNFQCYREMVDQLIAVLLELGSWAGMVFEMVSFGLMRRLVTEIRKCRNDLYSQPKLYFE